MLTLWRAWEQLLWWTIRQKLGRELSDTCLVSSTSRGIGLKKNFYQDFSIGFLNTYYFLIFRLGWNHGGKGSSCHVNIFCFCLLSDKMPPKLKLFVHWANTSVINHLCKQKNSEILCFSPPRFAQFPKTQDGDWLLGASYNMTHRMIGWVFELNTCYTHVFLEGITLPSSLWAKKHLVDMTKHCGQEPW